MPSLKSISLPLVYLALISPLAQADPTTKLNAELEALVESSEAIAKGEQVYRQMCFACHGANLEGAAGPSLNDPDWLHGSRPSDMYRVITKGISEKGMMPYEAIYDESTRKGLVAYILSQQVGFRDVAFEIYPPVADPTAGLPGFGSGTPLKTGTLSDSRIDLSVAEMAEYAIVFRGRSLKITLHKPQP